MKNKNLIFLAEAAIMIAAATVLSLFKIWEAPLGGSITLASVLPLAVIGYRHGILKGLGTAFVASVLQLMLGLQNLAYGTTWYAVLAILLFDYIVAFSCYGITGIFRKFGKGRISNTVSFTAGFAIASVLRFLCHFITGAVVWHSLTRVWYADDPTHIVHKYGPWIYSFIYNIGYMLPDMLIAAGVGVALSLALDFKKDNLIYAKK